MNRSRSFAVLIFAVVLSAFLLVACGGSKTDDSKALQAHQWKAVTVTGLSATSGQPVTAAFENGTITGSTGINDYQGAYEAQPGDAISIRIGPMTRAAGAPAAMKVETAYIAALGQAASYKADGSKLTLASSSGAELVVYNAYTPASLTGTAWACTMYNNGKGGFQSTAASSTVTAKFDTDGTMTGNGGVNDYHTSYSTSAGVISIQAPTVGRMAGPQELMDQEAAYFAALPKARTYIIEGSRLTMRAVDGAAMVEYVAK